MFHPAKRQGHGWEFPVCPGAQDLLQPQHSHFEDDDLVFGCLPHFPPIPLQKLLAGVQLPCCLLLGPEDFTELLPARVPPDITPFLGTTETGVLGWFLGPPAFLQIPVARGDATEVEESCVSKPLWKWEEKNSSEKQLIWKRQIHREGGEFAGRTGGVRPTAKPLMPRWNSSTPDINISTAVGEKEREMCR